MSCNWLTINQFAERIQVSPGTVRRWVKLGKISHINIEGVVRICERATDVFQKTVEKEVMHREDMLPDSGDSKWSGEELEDESIG